MYKVDAHNHPDFCNVNFEKAIANMDELGIAKMVMLSWENPWNENYMWSKGTFPSPLNNDVPVSVERCLDF